MRRFILLAVILLLPCFLLSCFSDSDENELLNALNEYERADNTYIIVNDEIIFKEHSVKLNEISPNGEFNGGCVVTGDKIYFSVSVKNGPFSFHLYIYECDHNGEEIKQIGKKEYINTHPWAIASGENIYIELFTKNAFDLSSREIYKFNTSTKSLSLAGMGSAVSLSSFEEKADYPTFKISDNGEFILYNQLGAQGKTITKEMLSDISCAPALEGYTLTPHYMAQEKSPILVYLLEPTDEELSCVYIVLSFDFENDSLEYKTYFSAPVSTTFSLGTLDN